MNCGLRRGRWITAALRGRRRSLHNYSTNVLIMEEQRGSSRVCYKVDACHCEGSFFEPEAISSLNIAGGN